MYETWKCLQEAHSRTSDVSNRCQTQRMPSTLWRHMSLRDMALTPSEQCIMAANVLLLRELMS